MLNKLSEQIHQNAVEHGWWDDERSFGDIIALCHSELSEALEEYRAGKSPTEVYYIDKITGKQVEGWKEGVKPEGIGIELADCIIRILDYCGKKEIDIDAAIRIKHSYNKTRSYKHGGKTI
jgi:NTP pyrophosphatase (non-canonical NTP hydrolase)